ncbi:hypothetical protein FRB94_007933 [Tulasnella sp. JGI-2019a]|nr:hypothetical protein FRB94_007933 [Tulasnella sp. JGI-2019a]
MARLTFNLATIAVVSVFFASAAAQGGPYAQVLQPVSRAGAVYTQAMPAVRLQPFRYIPFVHQHHGVNDSGHVYANVFNHPYFIRDFDDYVD